jgi:hypothetical protein
MSFIFKFFYRTHPPTTSFRSQPMSPGATLPVDDVGDVINMASPTRTFQREATNASRYAWKAVDLNSDGEPYRIKFSDALGVSRDHEEKVELERWIAINNCPVIREGNTMSWVIYFESKALFESFLETFPWILD